MERRAIAGWGFVFAGVVFLVVGALPVFQGQQAKTSNIGLAIACLIIGAIIARRARSGTPPRP